MPPDNINWPPIVDRVDNTADRKLPRGIRNNNPGNIRLSTNNVWQGEVEGSDDTFVTFMTPYHGLRAMAKLLLNYQRIYGLRTIRAIVARWAPSNENHTDAYVQHVALSMNVSADKPIDVTDEDTLLELMKAIIKVENGAPKDGDTWYSTVEIRGAIRAAK